MSGILWAIATGAGGVATVVATIGLSLSVGIGDVPEPAFVVLLVCGAVALIARFVVDFERQSRRHAYRTRVQIHARLHQRQLLVAAPAAPLQLHTHQR